jgi:hypothetical protein
MNADEFLGMSPEHQAKIRSSFDFLNQLDVQNIGGTDFLTKDGVPLNALRMVKESDFVKEWLVPFALNNTATRNNYFNFPKWGELSNQHTMCVLVVDDNDSSKRLFVVKPLASYEMSPQEREIMRQATAALQTSIQTTLDGQEPELSSDRIVETAKQYITNDVNTPIHELIPTEFYHKHGLYVTALREAVWVRDEFLEGNMSREDFSRFLEIRTKEERDGVATREEYEFIRSFVPHFEIPEDKLAAHGDKGGQVKNNGDDNNTVIDPMSC